MNDVNATLIKHQNLNEGLGILHVRPDGGLSPFHAGQFMMAGLPDPLDEQPAKEQARPQKVLRRAYSIASSPSQNGHVEFFVVRVDGGRLTPMLWDLKEGDRLFLDNRGRGHFHLEGLDLSGDALLMLATGTGLAPFVAMIREFRQKGFPRRVILVHGVRHRGDLGYEEEFRSLAAERSDFEFLPVTSREDAPPEGGLRGHLQQILDPESFKNHFGEALAPAHMRVLLCGNPAMIENSVSRLGLLGFTRHSKKEPGNLHFEKYW